MLKCNEKEENEDQVNVLIPGNLNLPILGGKWEYYDSGTFIFNFCGLLIRIQQVSSENSQEKK